MATVFASTIAPRSSTTPTAVAIVSPFNGLGVTVASDQALSISVQVSTDSGATYATTPQNIDLPLAGSIYRTVVAQGSTNIRFVVANPGDVLANVTLEANSATF